MQLNEDKMPYVPTDADKEYIKNVMHMLKDGGVFAYPRSGLMYQKISAKKIKLTGLMPDSYVPDNLKNQLEYQQKLDRKATIATCKSLGIEIEDDIQDS